MNQLINGITNSSSLLINLPTNINLITYKKNTKVVKFILLSELVYIVISQSRNYKKLYNNIILQINLIKKKLFFIIKNFIENKNKKEILILKEKLDKANIIYDDFILMIFLNNKEFYVKKKIRNELSLEIKKIKRNLLNNNLYHKYLYLKKIVIFINKLIYSKLETFNSFFYHLIFKLLKKESHRLKLKILISKMIRTYIFNGINLNLSRQILQKYLLKCFNRSKIFNFKYLLPSEEIHVKERKPLSIKRDLACSIKEVLNFCIKQNYGFSYYKLLKKLKNNNLENISINSLFIILNNIEQNSIYGIFKNRGIIFNINDNYQFLKGIGVNYNNEYSLLNKYNLFESNVDLHMFKNKDFLNIYSIYNIFNLFMKRGKKNFFLDSSEKIIELFGNSYVKYIYFTIILENVNEKEIEIYKMLKNIYHILINNNLKSIKKFKLKGNKFKSVLNLFIGEDIYLYDLKKKMNVIEELTSNNIKYFFNSYFFKINNLYRIKNFDTNFDQKNINIIFNNFNFSNLFNQLYLNLNLNVIFKKYFNIIRSCINSNFKEQIKNLFFITLNNNNKLISSSILPTKINIASIKNQLISTINNTNEDKKKIIDDLLLKYESLFLNRTLFIQIYNVKKYTNNNLIVNKEIIENVNIDIVLLSRYKYRLLKKFNHNLIILSNKNNSFFNLKTYFFQENINDFFYKKLLLFNNLIKLTRKDFNFIIKNKILFTLQNKNEYLYDLNKVNLDKLTKINNSFMLDDFHRIITHTVDYTTTELLKITKYQTKKKKFTKMY
jgi:hypothetical protein